MNFKVTTVDYLPSEKRNKWYDTYKEPLIKEKLIKLPLGSIKPKGWLLNQLEYMKEGMVGRLDELSTYVETAVGWKTEYDYENPFYYRGEEVPYWLRGVFSLAVATEDEKLLNKCQKYINYILDSQKEDGYFGPVNYDNSGMEASRHGSGNVVLLIHALALDSLIKAYEYTRDERIIPFMTRFFEYCRSIPDSLFFANDENIWHRRPCELMEHLFWLYSHKEEKWLLELAARFYRRMPHSTDSYPGRQKMLSASVNDGLTRRRSDEWLAHHTVDFAQNYTKPGIYYALSKQAYHSEQTEYWYKQHMATWGQQPRGLFAADEVLRYTFTDPRQGTETCTMVELNKGFYSLSSITGKTEYADKCEDIMFNHFPASYSPDYKAIHYLTASNQPILDDKAETDYANGSGMVHYSPHKFRCCQHNNGMGWPWFAEHLLYATQDNGLAFWIYSPCSVSAFAGSKKTPVNIAIDTGYPFSGKMEIEVSPEQETEFPLYFRIPGWCESISYEILRKEKQSNIASETNVSFEGRQNKLLKIDGNWEGKTVIKLEMHMKISAKNWPRNGSVTIDRGPLSYSVRIKEQWDKCGGTEEWPEWKVTPKSNWNYGLVLDRDNPDNCFEIEDADGKIANQPFKEECAPIVIKAKARKIDNWKLYKGMPGELQPSPVKTEGREESIELIPLGCARLRISCIPVAGDEPEAKQWKDHNNESDTSSSKFI